MKMYNPIMLTRKGALIREINIHLLYLLKSKTTSKYLSSNYLIGIPLIIKENDGKDNYKIDTSIIIPTKVGNKQRLNIYLF